MKDQEPKPINKTEIITIIKFGANASPIIPSILENMPSGNKMVTASYLNTYQTPVA